MNADRMVLMRAALSQAFCAAEIELTDDSHKHVGHAGARDGRGHFSLHIVSEAFVGLPLLARHRRVYAALGDLMTTDIHALAIQAHTPAELAGKARETNA